MNKQDTKLYQDIGEIKGMLTGMDKRLARVEQKQDEMHKRVVRNTTICSGVMSVAVSMIITQIKSGLGLGG